MYFDFFYKFYLKLKTVLLLRRIKEGMIKNLYSASCKVPVILVRF